MDAKIKAKLDHTIRHVQQEERAPAFQSALELGQMLAREVRAFDKNTGRPPSDAIQAAWTDLMTISRELVGAGGFGGPMATRVRGAFDDVVRASPNPAIRNYNDHMMQGLR
jgi:hypothetical protein